MEMIEKAEVGDYIQITKRQPTRIKIGEIFKVKKRGRMTNECVLVDTLKFTDVVVVDGDYIVL
jgi:hypothetical protein